MDCLKMNQEERLRKDLLHLKTYAYLMDDGSEKKKPKGTKKCIIKRELMFENYRDCLFNGKVYNITVKIQK